MVTIATAFGMRSRGLLLPAAAALASPPMIHRLPIVTLLSIIALASTGGRQPVHASTPVTALDGRWVSACIAMGRDGRHGTVLQLTIVGKRIDALANTYAHATCDVPTILSRLSTRLVSTTHDGSAIDAVLRVQAVTMAPQATEVVRIWNDDRGSKHCANRPWRLRQAQSVAGKDCGAGLRFPNRRATIRVSVEPEGDRLWVPSPLGRGADGSTPRIVLTRLQ